MSRLHNYLSLIVNILIVFLPLDVWSDVESFYTFESGNWIGDAWRDKATLEFSQCSISGQYESGTNIFFSIMPDNTFVVLLSNDGWIFDNNNQYPADIYIDNRYMGHFIGSGKDNEVIFNLGDKNRLINNFKLGRALTFKTAGGNLAYNLTGTNKALSKLEECVHLANAFAGSRGSNKNPFYSGSTNPFSAGNSSEQQHYLEVKNSFEILIKAAGLENSYMLDDPSKMYKDATYAWVDDVDNVQGGYIVIRDQQITADSTNKITAAFMSSIGEACNGDLFSGQSPTQHIGRFNLQKATLKCNDVNTPLYISSILITSDKEAEFILNFSNTDSGGTKLEEVSTNLVNFFVNTLNTQ